MKNTISQNVSERPLRFGKRMQRYGLFHYFQTFQKKSFEV